MSTASRRIIRPLPELGGDAAFIVFDDADIEAAVDGAMVAKFRNTGQSCIAANRFFVFTSRFVERINAMHIGDGLADPCPDLNPFIDRTRANTLRSMTDEATAASATVLTRQFDLPDAGNYVAPTLLADVPNHVGLAIDEVFGPVAAVFPLHNDAEVLARANATEMGLAHYFWFRDPSRCWRLAERLAAGIVDVNNALPSVSFAALGGVKQSGLGREGADIRLEEFTDIRYMALGL